MKKNLFGAVAAGLALALAFTACESGNDNPIRVKTDADLAAAQKTEFVYVNKTTDYDNAYKTIAGTPWTGATEYATGGVGHWTWSSFEKGENKWNRDVAAYSSVYSNMTSNRGTPDGKTVGDVIKTSKKTVTLNSGDNTFTVVDESTNKEVFAIKNWDYTSTAVAPITYTGAVAEYGYASRKQIPWKIVSSGISLPANIDYFAVTNAVVGTSNADVTAGISVYNALTGSEAATRDSNIALLKAAIESQEKHVARLKDNPDANGKNGNDSIKTAETVLATIKGYYANALAAKDGAAYVILTEETKDGVTKSTTVWTKKVDGTDVVRKNETTSGTESKTEGVYKLLTGNYRTGTFLVTKIKTQYKVGAQTKKINAIFADTNTNNTGTWTDGDDDTEVGDIARDYPVATTTVAGSAFQYAGRLFQIENGVLRGTNAVIVSQTATWNQTRQNIFGWNYQTYANVYTDTTVTTNVTYTDTNKAFVTYDLQ